MSASRRSWGDRKRSNCVLGSNPARFLGHRSRWAGNSVQNAGTEREACGVAVGFRRSAVEASLAPSNQIETGEHRDRWVAAAFLRLPLSLHGPAFSVAAREHGFLAVSSRPYLTALWNNTEQQQVVEEHSPQDPPIHRWGHDGVGCRGHGLHGQD